MLCQLQAHCPNIAYEPKSSKNLKQGYTFSPITFNFNTSSFNGNEFFVLKNYLYVCFTKLNITLLQFRFTFMYMLYNVFPSLYITRWLEYQTKDLLFDIMTSIMWCNIYLCYNIIQHTVWLQTYLIRLI